MSQARISKGIRSTQLRVYYKRNWAPYTTLHTNNYKGFYFLSVSSSLLLKRHLELLA